MPPTIAWNADAGALSVLDQTKLPGREDILVIDNTTGLIAAIQSLAVRGAPALGVAGAYGVALAVLEGERLARAGAGAADVAAAVSAAVDAVRTARPTAVNLAWGVAQVEPLVPHGLSAVLEAAHDLARADLAGNQAMGVVGADWLAERLAPRLAVGQRLRALTHCNTGALATTGWGTALGVIRTVFDRGQLESVLADETRPLLQGSRLTAWELDKLGIPHQIQVDGAAASAILGGLVDFAVVGADRIAANGDTANKIGTLGVALACHAAGIPFMVAAPTLTIDPLTATGAEIHVELRDHDEITTLAGVCVAPAASPGFNPAFDVTPYRYIDAIVTEQGLYLPPG